MYQILIKFFITKVVPPLFTFWFIESMLIANQVEPNLAGILSTAAAFGSIALSIKFTGFL